MKTRSDKRIRSNLEGSDEEEEEEGGKREVGEEPHVKPCAAVKRSLLR